jgi:hypothetical protein
VICPRLTGTKRWGEDPRSNPRKESETAQLNDPTGPLATLLCGSLATFHPPSATCQPSSGYNFALAMNTENPSGLEWAHPLVRDWFARRVLVDWGNIDKLAVLFNNGMCHESTPSSFVGRPKDPPSDNLALSVAVNPVLHIVVAFIGTGCQPLKRTSRNWTFTAAILRL